MPRADANRTSLPSPAEAGTTHCPPHPLLRARRSRRLSRTRRRGYTLVFFAMCLFAFMAMAALVIDLGFIRLTQRQMQTAVDNAAVEGLRGEGEVPYEQRRELARQFAQWHFDDDLETSADDGAFDSGTGQFGAGPVVQFSGTVGDPSLNAGQLMEVDPDNPTYKPVMVNGTPTASGSFQVDMVRGNGVVAQGDLLSVGPAVPFLFARGSMIDRQLVGSGITVQATGSASFETALSVGLPDDASGLRGLAPFALQYDPVEEELDLANPYLFEIDPDMPMPVAIGRALPTSSGALVEGTSGYAPIYAQLTGSSQQLVIGFVSATVTAGPAVVVDANQQAPMNASTILCYLRETSTTPEELSGAIALNRQARETLSMLQAARP